MLRKLFNRKPRLDAENSADRIAALAALEDADQETFARVFEEDSSREVRLRALARLTRPDVLVKALDDTEIGGEALSRLLAVIDDDTPESIRHHPTVLQAALSGAEEPGEAVRAAAAMADKGAMAEALGKNVRADVRLAVVEATWEPPSLTELERASRGRDKSVHRVARGRLATLRTASSRRQEENTQTEQMLEAALALADDDPHYDARRDANRTRLEGSSGGGRGHRRRTLAIQRGWRGTSMPSAPSFPGPTATAEGSRRRRPDRLRGLADGSRGASPSRSRVDHRRPGGRYARRPSACRGRTRGPSGTPARTSSRRNGSPVPDSAKYSRR